MSEEQDKILRLQALKVEALRLDLESLNNEVTKKDSLCNELDMQGRSITNESQKYLAQINQLTTKIEQHATKNKQNTQLSTEMQKTNVLLKNEFDLVNKDLKKRETETNKKDIRINRLQEEIDRIKVQQQMGS